MTIHHPNIATHTVYRPYTGSHCQNHTPNKQWIRTGSVKKTPPEPIGIGQAKRGELETLRHKGYPLKTGRNPKGKACLKNHPFSCASCQFQGGYSLNTKFVYVSYSNSNSKETAIKGPKCYKFSIPFRRRWLVAGCSNTLSEIPGKLAIQTRLLV